MRWLMMLLPLLLAMMPARDPDLTLSGVISAADHQSYVRRDIVVPPGVTAMAVDFGYDRNQGIVIDLGLIEGDRLRGWSGGNKSAFRVGAGWATPSYRPGGIDGRTLTLVLGVPEARPGSKVAWHADISFSTGEDLPPPDADSGRIWVTPRLSHSQPKAGWLRGELHSHSAHSDGVCSDTSGDRRPCPVVESLNAAAAAGMDFISLTDHNTVSQNADLGRLAARFPGLIIIPGQEITSFFGHANLFGPDVAAPFMLVANDAATTARWQSEIAAMGGLLAVNHPALPSGAICMGCGWTLVGTNWSKVAMIEVINGGAVAAFDGRIETPIAGIAFWQELLDAGQRLIAIAGSDNHDAQLRPPDPRAIGSLRTVVWADRRSTAGVLAGLKKGRAFIEIGGPGTRVLDMNLAGVTMGGKIPFSASPRPISITVKDCAGCSLELLADGKVSDQAVIPNADHVAHFKVGARHSIRAQVRTSDGRLALLGNPIFVE